MLVYAIRQAHSNYYKIGQSNGFNTRLTMLQIGNPVELYPVIFISPRRSLDFSIEGALHGLLQHCRMRGEWFFIPGLSDDPLSTVEEWMSDLGLVIYKIGTKYDVPVVFVEQAEAIKQRIASVTEVSKQIMAHLKTRASQGDKSGAGFEEIATTLEQYRADLILQGINDLVGKGYARKQEGDGTRTVFFANAVKSEPRVIYCYQGPIHKK